MKIALVAPSGVPFVVGGAEKLWWGLTRHINRHTTHELELIKLPSPERDLREVVASYERWARLDLSHFDAVISTKYPAWMVEHPRHVVYMQHTLRGLYDTYPATLAREPTVRDGPLGRLAQALRALPNDRAVLDELFAELAPWRERTDPTDREAAALWAFPGPFARALVRKLDSIALDPAGIHAHLAISLTVARRAGYFPPGVQPEVLPHPSDLEGLGPREGREGAFRAGLAEATAVTAEQFVFSASRLDRPKRLDLLIEGYRRAQTSVPLVIAGDGPEAARLRELASGDPRIRFAGRLSDEALVEHYRQALLVPFVPRDEDMGLITLEAMAAGVPVLTVYDAGGVTEFVKDGANGRVVKPTPAALGAAIDELLSDRARLAHLGLAASETALGISWDRTAQGLLRAIEGSRRAAGAAIAAEDGSTSKNSRVANVASVPVEPITSTHSLHASGNNPPRLLVLNTFPVYPPDSGGKKRILHLYSALAERADVTLLNLDSSGVQPQQFTFSQRLREIRVPASTAFDRVNGSMTLALRRSVTDLAALLHWQHLDALRTAFKTLTHQADVVVASHVYLAPMIQALWQGPVWYDAHNVEADMKADVLGVKRLASSPTATSVGDMVPSAWDATALVTRVALEEARLVRSAQRVFAVSDDDRQRLAWLSGRAPASIECVPNGTALLCDAAMDGPSRGELKRRLGLDDRPLAVFVGALHGPNIEALSRVLAIARNNPAWCVAVAGSVCRHLKPSAARPAELLDILSDAELGTLLAAADVGLNPMSTGSGTNMKMLDYALHGGLILSSPQGARGLGLVDGEHLLVCNDNAWDAMLDALRPECPGPRPTMRAAARALVETRYGWSAIAAAVAL